MTWELFGSRSLSDQGSGRRLLNQLCQTHDAAGIADPFSVERHPARYIICQVVDEPFDRLGPASKARAGAQIDESIAILHIGDDQQRGIFAALPAP